MNAFAALADPIRQQIVELLAGIEELPAGKIAESFPSVTRAAVSRHLRTLEDSGLLAVRTRAQQRLYRLNPEPLDELERWLERYRSMWTRKIGALAERMEARK